MALRRRRKGAAPSCRSKNRPQGRQEGKVRELAEVDGLRSRAMGMTRGATRYACLGRANRVWIASRGGRPTPKYLVRAHSVTRSDALGQSSLPDSAEPEPYGPYGQCVHRGIAHDRAARYREVRRRTPIRVAAGGRSVNPLARRKDPATAASAGSRKALWRAVSLQPNCEAAMARQ